MEAWRAARDRPDLGRERGRAVAAACGPSDGEAYVVAMRTLGWCERVLCRYPESRRALNAAVAVARRRGLMERLSEALISRSSLELDVGRSGAALRDVSAARAALSGGTTVELDAQEALVEMKFGHYGEAVELGQRAQRLITGSTSPVTSVMVLTNLGESLSHLGRFAEADAAFGHAVTLAEDVGRLNLGMVIQTRAAAAVRGGRPAEGLAMFDVAEGLLRDAGWPLGEHYLERIDSFATLRLVEEADGTVERAVTHFAQAGLALLLAEARLRQARLLLANDQWADAIEPARVAAELFRRQRRSGYRALADLAVVESTLRSGRISGRELVRAERARTVLEAAGASLDAVDAQLLVGRVAEALGRVEVSAGAYSAAEAAVRAGGSLLRVKGFVAGALRARLGNDPAGVRSRARRGLEEVATYRAALPSTELRALASAHGVELAVLGLQTALVSGTPAEALEWIERGRLASVLTSPPAPDDAELHGLSARLREVAAEERSEADLDRRAKLQAESRRVESRIQRRIRTLDPEVVQAGQPATAREIVDGLAGRTLVSLAALDARIVAVVMPAKVVVELGVVADVARALDGLLFALRRMLRPGSTASRDALRTAALRSLGDLDGLLAAPLVHWVGDRVVIVPTAGTFAVPWHALASLAGRSVTIAPSATVWIRALRRAVRPPRVVAVAGPDLTGADEEVAAVGDIHGGATVIGSSDARVDVVRDAFARASFAHIACHGSFRADNPSFSSLVLADGPLTVLDLESLGRTPDAVVLAACDSGASAALPGEELRGLLSALFMLGTRSVIATSVPVPDVGATPLMLDLHRRVAAGRPLAVALEDARAGLDVTQPEGLVLDAAFACFGVGDELFTS